MANRASHPFTSQACMIVTDQAVITKNTQIAFTKNEMRDSIVAHTHAQDSRKPQMNPSK